MCVPTDSQSLVLHATSVRIAGHALLIGGPSGAGKSSLALQLMAFGAELIADDMTLVTAAGGQLIASAPPTLPAAIEIRGLGLVAVTPAGPAPVLAFLDLARTAGARLPDPAGTEICGISVSLLHKIEGPYFSSAILQYVKSGGVMQT